MKALVVVGACALLLGGCATDISYDRMGAWGGVEAQRIDSETVLISGRGNAFTSPDRVQFLLLTRAADEAVKSGYDLFYVATEQDRSHTNYVALPGHAVTTASGGDLSTTYTPGPISALHIPAGSMLVKMLRGTKPNPAPPGLYDAREVLRYATRK